MVDVVDIQVRDTGTPIVVRNLQAVGLAAAGSAAQVTFLNTALASLGSGGSSAALAALGRNATAARLQVASLTTAMATLNASSVAMVTPLNQAGGAMQRLGSNTSRTTNLMATFFAAFAGWQVVSRMGGALIRAQVAMQEIHFGLIAATGSARGATEQFKFVEAAADKLGLSLETSAREYTRLAASATAMNVPVEKQQELYLALAKTSTVLHLSQEKVQRATMALSQMFSKGRIQAEELRQQLGEHIPGIVPRFQAAVMKMVQGTDLAKYSFEDLMKRGLLNTAKFLPQLVEALETTGRGWEEASKGMNAEINRLRTAWFQLKVDISEGLFTDVVTASVRFLSQNLRELAALFVGVGVAVAAAFTPFVIARFATALKALWVVAAANPFLAMAAVILGVVSALVFLRDDIKLGIDDTTSLGDLMRAAWEGMVPVFTSVGNKMAETFSAITGASAGTFQEMTSHVIGYEHRNEASWLQLARFIAKTLDMVGGVVRGWAVAFWSTVKKLVDLVIQSFNNLGTAMAAAFEGNGEGVKAALQSQQKLSAEAGTTLASTFSNAFRAEVLAGEDSGIESVLNGWIKRAKEIGDLRTKPATEGAPDPASPFEPPKPPGTGSGKAAKDLVNDLDSLMARINPVYGGLLDLADAQSTFDAAVSEGLIDRELANEYMAEYANHLKDITDPLGYMLDEMGRENGLLKLLNDEARVEEELHGRINELRRAGVILSAIEIDQLRAKIVVTQELSNIAQARDAIYDASSAARVKSFKEEAEALKQLLALGRKAGGLDTGDAADPLSQMLPWANLDNTQQQMAAYIQAHADMYAQIKVLEDKSVIDSQTAGMLRAQADAVYSEQRLIQQQTFFGTLAQLSGNSNRKLAAIGKAAAISQAVIDGVLAVQKALASSPPPFNFIMATAVGAVAAANVANIVSQPVPGYRTGGEMIVGGSGGPDSQDVRFRATPGERIQINTPTQARALERSSEAPRQGDRKFVQNLTIVQQGIPDRKTSTQQAKKVRKQSQKEFERNN